MAPALRSTATAGFGSFSSGRRNATSRSLSRRTTAAAVSLPSAKTIFASLTAASSFISSAPERWRDFIIALGSMVVSEIMVSPDGSRTVPRASVLTSFWRLRPPMVTL